MNGSEAPERLGWKDVKMAFHHANRPFLLFVVFGGPMIQTFWDKVGPWPVLLEMVLIYGVLIIQYLLAEEERRGIK